jgi:TIR domain
MPARPAVFISHTTRDKRDFALTHKLASALRLRGAEVWIAPESIPSGDRWAADIVEGVMQRSSHFLVILSAASIQADWVLREIELARKRQARDPSYRVLPLAVGSLGPFPGKEHLAALQQVPYRDEFGAQVDAVAAAIGLRPSTRVMFPPTAVAPGEFVGRDYVFEAITAFITGSVNGYFVIEGDPGAGKSAILSEFVRRSGCIAFFNVRSLGVNTAQQFLESACAQLIARYGLDYPALPSDATRNGDFLTRLIEEASTRLGAGEKIIIAVDALDEVDMTGHPAGANVLFLPARLPERVYVVATRREVNLPFTVYAPQDTYDLLEHRAETDNDVRTYVERAAEGAGVRDWLRRKDIGIETFIVEIVRLSEGNFMYLRHVLPEIAAGRYENLDIQALPKGLEGYYEDHWRRMGMTARPLPVAKIRVIYVLSELRKPLSRKFIAELGSNAELRLDELTVQDVLDEWSEFLHEQPVDNSKRYSLYHASFRDFLHRRDIVQAAGVTIEGINALISDTLWDDLFASGPADARAPTSP